MTDILSKLERFGISAVAHGQSSLIAHLQGTCEILQGWECGHSVCLAGLCHSIYGTESFSLTPVSLENRTYVRSLIGREAEGLAYLFGAHVKESLWRNLDRGSGFNIEDRFTRKIVALSEGELADLLTLTLANWLEQRPRASVEHQFIRKKEFLRSKGFLPTIAYQDFLTAYGLNLKEQGSTTIS